MRFYLSTLLALLVHLSYSQNFNTSTIPKELLSHADAVVRLDRTDVVVEARNRMNVTSTRVVTVLNENGNEHVQAYAFYEKNV